MTPTFAYLLSLHCTIGHSESTLRIHVNSDVTDTFCIRLLRQRTVCKYESDRCEHYLLGPSLFLLTGLPYDMGAEVLLKYIGS